MYLIAKIDILFYVFFLFLFNLKTICIFPRENSLRRQPNNEYIVYKHFNIFFKRSNTNLHIK